MKLGQLWLSCGLGGVILAGVMIDRAIFQVPAENSIPYHEHVAAVARDFPPLNIGGWIGTDVPVPVEAKHLLRPNVLISREYVNTKLKQQFGLLLVQCSDARDLAGHYPPVCYPNAGYTQQQEKSTPDIAEAGTMYQFTQDTLSGTRGMWVYNAMILPNNRTSPNMEGVYSIARNRRLRFFGAAEIQVITEDEMEEADRSAVVNLVLENCKPLMDAIRSGVVQ